MNIAPFPFQITDWAQIEKTEHYGETGIAYWRTQYFGTFARMDSIKKLQITSLFINP